MIRSPSRKLLLSLGGLLLLLVGLFGGARWYLGDRFELARQAMHRRDYVAAEAILADYLRWRPSDVEARLMAARAARRLTKFDVADEHLRRCRRDGGPHDKIDLEFDLIEARQGDPILIRALRARADRDNENGPEILEVLTQVYLELYLLQDARRCLDRYLEYRPDDLQALLSRAFVWERMQMYPDALRDYRRAVQTHPENPQARLKLAQTLLISGTPTEALAEFTRLEETLPNHRDVQLGLARCERRLAQAEQAATRLDRLLRTHPRDGELLRERGQAALDLNDVATAERFLTEASKQLPNDRETWHSLAGSLRRQGKKNEADKSQANADRLQTDLDRMQKISEAVMRSPNDANLRYEGGLLFQRNGEINEAIRWFRMALQLDPNHAEARESLEKIRGSNGSDPL